MSGLFLFPLLYANLVKINLFKSLTRQETVGCYELSGNKSNLIYGNVFNDGNWKT